MLMRYLLAKFDHKIQYCILMPERGKQVKIENRGDVVNITFIAENMTRKPSANSKISEVSDICIGVEKTAYSVVSLGKKVKPLFSTIQVLRTQKFWEEREEEYRIRPFHCQIIIFPLSIH